MAAITVTVERARPIESILQATHNCAVAVLAGQAVQLNASSEWILALADTAPHAAGVHIAMSSKSAGQGLTAMKIGEMGGIDIALAPGSAVFLGNVAGGLDTVAGTVPTTLGRVTKPGLWQVICPV